MKPREMVVISLIALNGAMLVFGYWLSIVLARRTLAPIERSIEQRSPIVSNAIRAKNSVGGVWHQAMK